MGSQDDTRRIKEELIQMEIRRRQMADLREHTEESRIQMEAHLRKMEELKRKVEEPKV